MAANDEVTFTPTCPYKDKACEAGYCLNCPQFPIKPMKAAKAEPRYPAQGEFDRMFPPPGSVECETRTGVRNGAQVELEFDKTFMPTLKVATGKPIIYISGPMRGHADDNFGTFNEVHSLLALNGWDVRNPASKGHLSADYTWEQAMTTDLKWVMESGAVCVLPGWEQSEGARLEVGVARALKKDFFQAVPDEDGWSIRKIDTPATAQVDGIDAEARRLVYGARAQTYGHPRGDFEKIAGLWSAILSDHDNPVTVTPEQVALMMAALKLARLSSTPTHRDSQVDTIGYMLCLSRLQESPEEIAAWESRQA